MTPPNDGTDVVGSDVVGVEVGTEVVGSEVVGVEVGKVNWKPLDAGPLRVS